jgi:hypothetical protein
MIRSRLHQKNPLQVSIESITRLRVKNLKNAFNRLISYFEYLGQGEFQTGYIFKKWWLDLSRFNLYIRGASFIYFMS